MQGEASASVLAPRVPESVTLEGGGARAIDPPARMLDAVAEGRSPRRTLVLDHHYRRLLALADVVACGAAMTTCIALLGRGEWALLGMLAALPLVVAMSKVLGLYDRDELVLRKSTLDEAPTLFQLATLFSFVLWIFASPLGLGELAGAQMAALWISLFLGLVGARVAARALARSTAEPERCLLLGDPVACARVRRKLEASSAIKAEVIAEITSARMGEVEMPISLLREIAAEREIQRIIIAPRSTDHGEVLNLVRAAKSIGLNVTVLPRLLEIVGGSVIVDDIGGLRVLAVTRFGLSRSSLIVKRALDVAASLTGLVLLAPLFALIALAIKAGSPGPVLFRQQRIGRDGRSFAMLKFRTMCVDAEARKDELLAFNEAPGLFKMEDDPRITSVGRVLRRLSLDELPQLVNVLRGEMSVVGPRPLVDEDDARIEGWYRHRLHLTPGMTGPWQVLGPGRLPLNEMVKLDYLYVATWSMWNDLKILLQTVAFVARRHNR